MVVVPRQPQLLQQRDFTWPLLLRAESYPPGWQKLGRELRGARGWWGSWTKNIGSWDFSVLQSQLWCWGAISTLGVGRVPPSCLQGSTPFLFTQAFTCSPSLDLEGLCKMGDLRSWGGARRRNPETLISRSGPSPHLAVSAPGIPLPSILRTGLDRQLLALFPELYEGTHPREEAGGKFQLHPERQTAHPRPWAVREEQKLLYPKCSSQNYTAAGWLASH